MWRQGDILLERVYEIPHQARKLKNRVIESSSTTGHQHKIQEKGACRLYQFGPENFLDVFAQKASLVHPEHDTIELETGIYRVWRQREFFRGNTRQMID